VSTRLVTWSCRACAKLCGRNVELEAEGVRRYACDEPTCGREADVVVTRSEAPIRPLNTPLQRAEWATERSRDARRILATLLPLVEEYLALHDMTIEDLPPRSPLRAAMLEARLELKKTAP
jgi:hypothetical protein